VPPLPGHPVSDEELTSLGFAPHEIEVRSMGVDLPGGRGCEWTTMGDVPDGPGLYAFTVKGLLHDQVTGQVVTYPCSSPVSVVTRG
jgi:hypothetical protein